MPTFGDMHPATSLKVAKQLRLRIIMSISRMSVSLGETQIRERPISGVLGRSFEFRFSLKYPNDFKDENVAVFGIKAIITSETDFPSEMMGDG